MYNLTKNDVACIDAFVKVAGKNSCSIYQGSYDFEVGIDSGGAMPLAYGSGSTIESAILEAIGSKAAKKFDGAMLKHAMDWLKSHNVVFDDRLTHE